MSIFDTDVLAPLCGNDLLDLLDLKVVNFPQSVIVKRRTMPLNGQQMCRLHQGHRHQMIDILYLTLKGWKLHHFDWC